MPTLKIYTRKESELNDATGHYVNIIAKVFERQDITVVYTHNIKDIQKDDFVLTITLRSFLEHYLRRKSIQCFGFKVY